MYEQGLGAQQSLSKSAGFYHEACVLGNAQSCVRAGGMYYQAQGVEQDVRKALGLFKRACELGELSGCKNYEMLKVNRWFE